MRRLSRLPFCFLLLTSFLSFLFLLSCTTPASQLPPKTAFYIYHFSPPAFVELSPDLQPAGEIPFSVPPDCSLFDVFPAPTGPLMLAELSCPNGQTVLFLDTDSAAVTQPITDSDSHFLAWTSDGKAAYLKIDSLGNAHVVLVDTAGRNDFIPVSEFTYDLSADPASHDFTFTFSRGLGQGSELWLAKRAGSVVKSLYADPFNYISFVRFSPDGRQITFIKIPDTQTPFTVGELWVMGSDGSNPRKIADADAGHGYAANWSPDGKRIAFVVRENPEDERANQSSEALISNLYVVDVQTGKSTRITNFQNGRVETPFWSPDGNTLAFNVVINDRMEVQSADLTTGKIRSLRTESTCCPAWLRK